MASISLTIPDGLIPDLVPELRRLLQERGEDTAGTNAQVARRYLASHVRLVYETAQAQAADATAQTAMQVARSQARADAAGIA